MNSHATFANDVREFTHIQGERDAKQSGVWRSVTERLADSELSRRCVNVKEESKRRIQKKNLNEECERICVVFDVKTVR